MAAQMSVPSRFLDVKTIVETFNGGRTMVFLLIAGCRGPIQDITVKLTDVETVAEVTWTTRKEAGSYVRFGPDLDMRLESPESNGTEHRAFLVGLTEDTEYNLQVVADDKTSEVITKKTGALPTYLPTFGLEGDAFETNIVAPYVIPADGTGGPMILDGSGNTLWYDLDTSGMYVPRARLAKDGSGVIYNVSDLNGNEDGTALVWVGWDGTELRREEVPLLGHDFVEKDDGTIVALTFEFQGTVKGNRLVEIAPDGSTTDVWNSWSCFDEDKHPTPEMEGTGWTFTNSLDYDPDTDTYYVGMRNFSSIAAVDGETGDCDWVFGNVAATMVDAAGVHMRHQHQYEILPDSLLVFDNDGSGEGYSRVVEYAFDGETAEAQWCYSTPDPDDPEESLYNVVLGDVHRTPEGDTNVTWATSSLVQRVDPAGELVGAVQGETGVVVGFTSFPDDLYNPSERSVPATAAHPADSGECVPTLPPGEGKVRKAGEAIVEPGKDYVGTETVTLKDSSGTIDVCQITYDLSFVADRMGDCDDKKGKLTCFWAMDLVMSNPVMDAKANNCDEVLDEIYGVSALADLDGYDTNYGLGDVLNHAVVLLVSDAKGSWNEVMIIVEGLDWIENTGELYYDYRVGDIAYQ